MRCPPAVHDYKPLGKILFCRRCADVQPLLLAVEYDEDLPAHGKNGVASVSFPGAAPTPTQEEPASVEELEHAANLLREAVGLTRPGSPEQLDLGVRHAMDDDELVNLSNARTIPRVPVHDGFEGGTDEDLPSPDL